MLHHVSFNAREPRAVAHRLAEVLGAHPVRAPQPPFPEDAWFIVYGNPEGTLIEILPWGHVLDPAAPGGMREDPDMRPRHGTHVLLGTSRSTAEVLALAQGHGWRALLTSAGLFSFVKIWVEDSFLVEVLSPDQVDDYRRAFNREGLLTLDGKLRQLESLIAARLSNE